MTGIIEQLHKPGDEVFSTRLKWQLADEIERLRNELAQWQKLALDLSHPQTRMIVVDVDKPKY